MCHFHKAVGSLKIVLADHDYYKSNTVIYLVAVKTLKAFLIQIFLQHI